MQGLGDLTDRTAGVTHVIDDQTVSSRDVTDDIHNVGLVRTLTALVAECEPGIESLCVCPRPLRPAGIRRDHDQIIDRVRTEIIDHNRRRIKVVNRNVEKSLYLRRVQIDGQYPLRPGAGYEV